MTTAIPRRHAVMANLGLFYAATIWGATFYIVKDTLDYIDPVVLVGYRFTLAGLILLGYLKATRRPILPGIGKGFILAIILWALYVSQTIGLGITTASNSGFITGLFVAFVPVFLRLILHRRPTVMEVAASALSLMGLVILTGGMTDVNAGDLLTLVAALTYALHLLYSDRFAKRGIDPYVLCCQQFLLVGAFSFLTALVFGRPFTVGPPAAASTVVFLALFPTLTALVIQLFAQKIVTPMRVTLIFALEPVFAGVFAWTLGGEEFFVRSAVGGLVIMAALMLSGLPAPRFLRRETKSGR